MAAGVNHRVTWRPFVRSWSSAARDTVATAAACEPSGLTSGTATAAVPAAAFSTVVVEACTARAASASASGRSPVDVLATITGMSPSTWTIVSVLSVGAVSTSS